MNDGGPLRLATRGSALAVRQAQSVASTLAEHRVETDLLEVETAGDRVRDELIEELGTIGAFVRSLDERVLDGDADAAVHSLKDVPTELPDDLVFAALPRRAAAGDVLVSPDGSALADLPRGAVVGTASMRRRAELLANRPDLEVRPLRGNVDTRVEKLLAPGLQAEHERRLAAEDEDEAEDGNGDQDDGEAFERSVDEWFEGLAEIERRALGREVDDEFDAIVLAEAGLDRSGLLDDLQFQRLPVDEFVPAPGQGAVVVTASDPDVVTRLRAALDHPRTRVETTVERVVLAEVGGGCIAPVGVHAVLRGDVVHVEARVLGPDGEREVRASRDVPVGSHAEVARDVAGELVEDGARELIAAAGDRR